MSYSVFINGLNSKFGGGKSILHNFLKEIEINDDSKYNFYVLVPKDSDYLKFSSKKIKIFSLFNFFNSSIALPFIYDFYLDLLIKKFKIDLVFNLADVPICTNVKQIFLFDWPYAAYPNSVVWNLLDFKSKFLRRIKLFYFKKNIIYVNKFIAQTECIATQLENIYNIDNIIIIPNAVSKENFDNSLFFDFKLSQKINLLYLTHYYPHKNLEILIPLALKVKRLNLNYRFILTIDRKQHSQAKKILDDIKKLDLEDFIYNVGPVSLDYVPSLYKQTDGLLMPTLLESFSGTYVEAMFHKKPIFTSDFDFAFSVCQEAAVYFNPFDHESILKSINLIFDNLVLMDEKIKLGSELVNSYPNWKDCYIGYIRAIDNCLKQD
jgi:glycosyltransferase involved in cell wall biosynthesis